VTESTNMSTMEMELSPPLPPPAPDASELRGKSTTPSSQDATDVPVTPKSHQEGEEGIVQQDGPKYPQPAYLWVINRQLTMHVLDAAY
jgi:hypothetical protein